ncbi:uncharacterized protein LOC124926687 [Impatiens glandulifera]|uniref:uncharacterized protein LOC124926687 n=1 Tax=Impatiens glandulifera TaxID=253017 RepID=UPI001FB0B639|nr:uncharacterized protein LOC124926687 [Impatiens glandulifera]
MGSSKEGRGSRILRGIKTLFFLMAMLFSLLLCAPVLLVIADAILPSALLSASLSPQTSLSFQTIYSHFKTYDFRYTLVDVPLISILRSAIIFCVYSICDGPSLSRGPYLGIAMVCSISSVVFVSVKASFVFSEPRGGGRDDHARAMEMAMFISSLILAVGHMVAAYRTSCRERRKLLVFKIDIEAVSSACKNGFPKYHKILQEERIKAVKGNL